MIPLTSYNALNIFIFSITFIFSELMIIFETDNFFLISLYISIIFMVYIYRFSCFYGNLVFPFKILYLIFFCFSVLYTATAYIDIIELYFSICVIFYFLYILLIFLILRDMKYFNIFFIFLMSICAMLNVALIILVYFDINIRIEKRFLILIVLFKFTQINRIKKIVPYMSNTPEEKKENIP